MRDVPPEAGARLRGMPATQESVHAPTGVLMRIFVTMLGFNRPEMIRGALENFEATTTDAEHRRCVKTLFYCGYPFPEDNRDELHRLAVEFGWWVTDIPNEGVMANHNRAIHDYCHMRTGDFYVTFDPDVRMQEKGWLSAMVEALGSDPNAMFCCAARRFHNDSWCEEQHGRSIHQLPSGLRIARYRHLIAWSMGMWKGEWLAARPRDFKADAPHYGYAEHADYARLCDQRKTWVSLVDFYDDHQGAEPLYTKWKAESAAHRTKLSFHDWLAATSSRA